MDYKAFFEEVLGWIAQANQAASQHGMDSQNFWAWVTESTSAMCRKYNDNRLVIKQMVMLVDWMEEVYESRKEATHELDRSNIVPIVRDRLR